MRTVVLVLISTFALSFAVHAEAVRHSTIAAACVPGDPAIQANRYFVTAGSVKHQQGATGLITLYCPIPPTVAEGGGTYNGLFMTYSVTGLTAVVNAEITAQLLRVDNSGNFSPVLVNFNSGDPVHVNSSVGGSYIEHTFNHTYDFLNFFYYVRVDINRSDDLSTAILYGIGLESLDIISGAPGDVRRR
jgi:hypothetical protein